MNEFIQVHGEAVTGVVEGWDRLIFRGTLPRLSYVEGFFSCLNFRRILLKDLGAFFQRVTDTVARRCQALAREADRPYVYLESSAIRKEQRVQQILAQHPVSQGLICVLACVEPCQSFEVHKNTRTRKLELVSRPRKCRFFYLY